MEENNIFKEIVSDKKLLLLLCIIIILGIFVRLYKYSEVGYWSDDETTLPTGLLWFYPHDYYPGLLGQGEPAFGNYIFGKACIMSGEDFSGVTKMQPRFYPGREILIGPQLVKANDYCHAPMYIFGVLFLIVSVILACMLLKKYGVILVASLLSFNSLILSLSRWIHVDIILYTFVITGLIFLFKAVQAAKGSNSERVWLGLAVAMMALAFSVKLPASMYIVFAAFVIAVKYKDEFKTLLYKASKGLDLNLIKEPQPMHSPNKMIVLLVLSLIIYSSIVYFTFERDFSNIPTIIKAYQVQGADLGTLSLNKEAFLDIKSFLLTFSNLEMILLIGALLYLPFAFKKLFSNNPKEKFISQLLLFFLVLLAITPSMKLERIFFLFAFGVIFAAGLLIDKIIEKYQLSNIIFFIGILLLISIPVYHAVYTSPDFVNNYKLYNVISNPESSTAVSFGAKGIGTYLQGLLKGNETYFPAEPMTMVTYYVKNNQQLQYYLFRENFKAQVGRSPSVQEYIQYFQPNNERIRYLLIDKYTQNKEEFVQDILQNYEPMHIIYQPSIKQVETIRVYDLDNLVKKK